MSDAAPNRLLSRLRRRRPQPQPATEPAEPLERLWEHVELLERLPKPRASSGVPEQLAGESLAARTELTPLERWEKISARSFKTYTAGSNHVRLRRLLDFVRDGDRVLDIGIGFGYVTAMLQRERRLAAYSGIDLKDQFIDAARDALRANGLDPAGADLEVGSVLDLDPAWVATRRPDVVLVLEVLEHIPDPAAALRALARSVPEHAIILFTVPLLGRLDGVWGHVSLFDRGRIEEICAQAGLTVHYVEPLHATWTLVAAAVGPETPDRLRPLLEAATAAPRALRKAASGRPHPAPGSYSVERVAIDSRQDYRRPGDDGEAVAVKGRLTGAYCEVTAPADAAVTGGVRLPMGRPTLIRLELSATNPEAIEELSVFGVDATGAERFGFRYRNRLAPFGAKKSYLLRPGVSTFYFRATDDGAEPGAVVALDVVMRVRRGGSSTLRVHRAAFAGTDAGAAQDDRSP